MTLGDLIMTLLPLIAFPAGYWLRGWADARTERRRLDRAPMRFVDHGSDPELFI